MLPLHQQLVLTILCWLAQAMRCSVTALMSRSRSFSTRSRARQAVICTGWHMNKCNTHHPAPSWARLPFLLGRPFFCAAPRGRGW